MLGATLAKVFGSKNDRMIKRYRQTVGRINELEETVAPLTDAELAAKSIAFRERIEKGEALDNILP